LDCAVKQYYAMKLSTILNAADKLESDVDYLCAIIEKPDFEFPIQDALVYASTLLAINNNLDFILEDLAERDLSDDEEYVKLTEEDIVILNEYTKASEEAIVRLEKTCGIYLQNN